MNKEHEVIEWTYKDSHRDYWRIRLWATGDADPGFDPENLDSEWCYTIEKEISDHDTVCFREIFSSHLVGLYDEPPKLNQIICDFMNYINHCMVGFACFGDKK